jgi:hypothetical protein
MDGSSYIVEYELETLLPKDQYYRFQTGITISNQKIDDASHRNLAALRTIAETMIEKRSADLEALYERLQQLAKIND